MAGTPRDIATLESWFETGDVPTQQQFYDVFRSFLHYLKIKQETGASTSDVMSQKAVTDALALAGDAAITADVTGGTITLDFQSFRKVRFKGSESFATAKIIALDNDNNGTDFTFKFIITNVAATLELPDNFIVDDVRYNPATLIWAADYPGSYIMQGEFDGTNWWIQQIKGPFIYPE